MHETSDFFNSIITFSYAKYFVHSYTVDVVFTFSYWAYGIRNPPKRSRCNDKFDKCFSSYTLSVILMNYIKGIVNFKEIYSW